MKLTTTLTAFMLSCTAFAAIPLEILFDCAEDTGIYKWGGCCTSFDADTGAGIGCMWNFLVPKDPAHTKAR
jgi:hypothetical protein